MAKVDLFPDFRELLKSLNSAGARYLVIGGYAVIHYGYRRATSDLDIWIATDPDNAERVSAALQEFGFRASTVRAEKLREPGSVFIFGRKPGRVDLLTSPSGVDFEASYTRRNVVEWDGIKVPLIGFEDLKRNKAASGRVKDLADIDNLPPKWPWPENSKAPKRKKK